MCLSTGHFYLKSEEPHNHSSTATNTPIVNEQMYPDLVIPSMLKNESTKSLVIENKRLSKEPVVIEPIYMKFNMNLKQMQIVLMDNNSSNELRTNESFNLSSDFSENSSDAFYLLTPLDINLSLEKCIYQEGSIVPDLKVSGELPILDLKLTDAKLEKLVNLVMSIPYPGQNDFYHLGLSFHHVILNVNSK